MTVSGNGSEEFPYVLKEESDLELLRQGVNKFLVLGNDITLTKPWIPITLFRHHFDGKGFRIDNLEITFNTGHVGLIQNIGPGTTIKNLSLVTSDKGVTGVSSYYKGVLAGIVYSTDFLVSNVSVSGTLNTGGGRAGGLIGYFETYPNQRLENCVCTVKLVGGGSFTSAVVGNNTSSQLVVKNIYFNSTISGHSSGGVAATNVTNITDTALMPGLTWGDGWGFYKNLPSVIPKVPLWFGDKKIGSFISENFVTRIRGLTTSADVKITLRKNLGEPYDGALVGYTTSNESGEWEFENLSEEFRYDVTARTETFNDVILSEVTPITKEVDMGFRSLLQRTSLDTTLENMFNYLDSSMENAPMLDGSPNSFLNLFKTCLIVGFNKHPVTSSKVDEGVGTFYFNKNNLFKKDQIVSLTGCYNQPDLNKNYKVISASSNYITLELEHNTRSIGGDIEISTASLGWSEVFSEEGSSLFKPALSNYFFKVKNTLKNIATVTGAEYVLDLHDFGDFKTTVSDWVNPAENTSWKLIGDGLGFYLLIKDSIYAFVPVISGDDTVKDYLLMSGPLSMVSSTNYTTVLNGTVDLESLNADSLYSGSPGNLKSSELITSPIYLKNFVEILGKIPYIRWIANSSDLLDGYVDNDNKVHISHSILSNKQKILFNTEGF